MLDLEILLSPKSTTYGVAWLAALALGAPLTAQAPPRAQLPPSEPGQEQVFGDLLEVRGVDVEVVVTDRRGERVEGLKREDFRLLVDGVEVSLESFRELRSGEVVAPEAVPEVAPEGDVSEAVPETAEGTSLLLFLDDSFTDRRLRNPVLKRLRAELDALGNHDRMAVVRFTGTRLEVLSGWTSSKEELRGVLDQAIGRSTGELLRRARTQTEDPEERFRLLADEIQRATLAAAHAQRSFAHVAGRKLLIVVSSGWSYDFVTMATASADVSASLLASAARYGGPQLLHPLTDTANLLGYTIYPFHLGLESALNPYSAERRSFSSGSIGAASSFSIPLESLQTVAEETGGRARPYAVAAKGLLHGVLEDVGSYYLLGFSTEPAGDDRRHRVEVLLDRAGLTARFRRGYLDISRTAQVDMQTEALLLLEQEGGDLEAELGVPEPTQRHHVIQVPLTVRIPMDRLLQAPGGDRYLADLELRIEALDERGDRSDLTAVPVALPDGEPRDGATTTWEGSVLLRRKPQRLVITLHDKIGGELLWTVLELEP